VILVGGPKSPESHHVRCFGALLDGDEDAMVLGRRLLDGRLPRLGHRAGVQAVQHVPGQEPPVRDPPGLDLDTRDLRYVLGTCGAYETDSHGVRAYR
jgi:hypothetical protein